jgi:hypothetical protein
MIAKASRFEQIVSDRAVTLDRVQNRGEARGFRQVGAPERDSSLP